jgi:lipid-A-disaccharide synthase
VRRSAAHGWVLVSAGEASGDRMAGAVVEKLARARPDLRFAGAGGECLARAGVEVRHHERDLSATGLVEAVRRAGGVARMLADLGRLAVSRPPALGLLVDYPGANLRLAGLLARLGVPVLYYGAPQRWAWLAWRTRPLARPGLRLAVTLPFEESWFRARGVLATYVGNPVVELFRPAPRLEARAQLGLRGDDRVLALLPGSRPGEIARHLPLLVQAAARLSAGGVRAVVAALPGPSALACQRIAPHLRLAGADLVLGAADAGLCASGTATLEAAFARVPVVVLYRLDPLAYAVARRLVRVRHIALPNLILDEALLPELIQDRASPGELARQASSLLDDEGARAEILAGYARVRSHLGPAHASERVAELALELLDSASG